jgi:hypothetical protein
MKPLRPVIKPDVNGGKPPTKILTWAKMTMWKKNRKT